MFKQFITQIEKKDGIDPRIVSYYRPGAVITDQYRNIKTYLNSLDGGNIYRSFLLTSANQQEGKSVTCVNLAMVMAEEKEKNVALIDANFRNPSIKALLNVEPKVGLSDYLTGRSRIDEIITSTQINNLMVITSGEKTDNPSELLAGGRMKELIEELEKHFNYIVIDSAAIIPFADVRMIAPLVDGVLIVVQAERTRREVVWRTQEQISNVRAKPLGVILTNVVYHIPEYIHKHL